ncbi:type-1 restriction enzyme EcoKI specificity protein [bacterium BMS3Abin06]|nr:type-1 restriction enzyme EcoKI specificity protein [bacterium BMS3Abin06]
MEGNKTVAFKFVPLSFISTESEIKRQSLNTVVFTDILNKYCDIREIGTLLHKTQYGYTASATSSGNAKFLRITDIKNGKVNWAEVPFCNCDQIDKYRLQSKDVLIARTGNNISYLVDSKVPVDAVFASYLIRLKCDENVLLPEYLYLFLNSYAFWPQILKKQKGALLQNVNAQRMRQLLIPYCPIEVQQEIIHQTSLQLHTSIISKQNHLCENLHLNDSLSNEITHQQTLLKKLRQSILQDAISGKLTEKWRKENPDVELATELLARIRAEKERLVKEKKIKQQKPLPPISENEIPFELPEGWVWCRLGDVGIFERGKSKHRPRNDESLFAEGIYPFVQTGNVAQSKKNAYIINAYDKCYNKKGLAQSKMWPNGTLCITIAANIAETGFLGIDACFPDSVVGFKPLTDYSLSKFIRYFIDVMKTDIERFAPATAQKNINLGIIGDLPFPLPPEKETNYIINKVESLFTYCDQLEQQINKSQQDSELLMQAVLQEAFQVETGVM